MPTYVGRRKDGTTFQLDWEVIDERLAHATKYSPSTNLCRFCLEKKPSNGIGIIIDGICSNACQESEDWLLANKHRFKEVETTKQEVPEEKPRMKTEYTGDPKAKKYFTDTNSRTYVMFSELLKAGDKGLLVSEIQKILIDLTGADEKSIKQDVSAKSSKWRSLKHNQFYNEWWLFVSGKPSRGRPSLTGVSKDYRMWIVFKNGDIPSQAVVEVDGDLPQWVKNQLKEKEDGS